MTMNTTGSSLPPGAEWEPDPHAASMTYLGAIWRRTCTEGSQVAMIAADHHLDSDGRVARGVILAFADHAVGSAGIARFGVTQVTIELEVRFIDTAGPGELIEGIGDLIGAAEDGDIVFLAGRISANGRLIATSQGLWKRVKPL